MLRSQCWRSTFLRVRYPVAYRPRPRYPSLALHNGASVTMITTRRRAITTTTRTSRGDAMGMRTRVDPECLMEDTESDLFNYTSGRFLANETRRLKERQRVFNIPGLFNIIAKALSLEPDDIIEFRKLGEGGFNRTFLVAFQNGTKIVARIPYPRLNAKAYVVASEVATMEFLRVKGLPIPEVFGYSSLADNEAQTEYILMEYIEGGEGKGNGTLRNMNLSELWFDLQKEEIVSLMDQLAKLESTIMKISFPAGGSIYHVEDLKRLSGNTGIPLEGPFCLGPDVSIPLWYGRRKGLDVFRGPYQDAESVLLAAAKKELSYLSQFASPTLPYQRWNREHYGYKKQQPSEHAENLHRYLLLAPSLVPHSDGDGDYRAFRLRHPDLTSSNIVVSRCEDSSSSSGGLKIVNLLDWQHAVVLPLFLQAEVPEFLQNGDDKTSVNNVLQPSLPASFDQLTKEEKEWEQELLRRRLVHLHYTISTALYNQSYYKSSVDPLDELRRRIFAEAMTPWRGETFKLRYALIQVETVWKSFTKDDTPCPVVFTEADVEETDNMYVALRGAEDTEKMHMNYVGYGGETWVPKDDYEDAKARDEKLKRMTLENGREREETENGEKELARRIDENWPLDDVSEEEWEECY